VGHSVPVTGLLLPLPWLSQLILLSTWWQPEIVLFLDVRHPVSSFQAQTFSPETQFQSFLKATVPIPHHIELQEKLLIGLLQFLLLQISDGRTNILNLMLVSAPAISPLVISLLCRLKWIHSRFAIRSPTVTQLLVQRAVTESFQVLH